MAEAADDRDPWFEELLGQAGVTLDQLGLATKEEGDSRREKLREMNIVREAMGTPAGQRFMRWLIAKVMRPPGDEELNTRSMEGLALLSARRNGERQIVLMIASAWMGPPMETQSKDDGYAQFDVA